jgi:gliding motility-associated-like protein
MIFAAGLLLCVAASAQENNFWYFGHNAGLNFNTSAPTPIVLNNSAMTADEASSAISDQSGNLLFYTNGITVYNKNHGMMINGNNIGGHISSCQMLIVPQPGNDSIYYIFTTGAIESDFQQGYRYSIVNMKRDNGRGEVVAKGVQFWPSCTERITAARHSNGVDVWIITNDNNSNTFRAWLLNCNGFQSGTHIASTVGAVLDQVPQMNVGLMKISPDGTQLCQTNFPEWDVLGHPANFAQLFDFDNTTGIISNARTLTFPGTQYTHVEFSPNSQFIYLTRPYDQPINGDAIDQFEAKLPTTAAILASRYVFKSTSVYYDIQMAPDEKLYLSRPSHYISAITQPNSKGALANLVEDAVPLSPGSTFVGLPSSINDANATAPANNFSYTIVDSCNGIVQFNANYNLPGVLTYEWDFGDGNTSNVQNPLHSFSPINQGYVVKLAVRSSLFCGAVFRTRIVKPAGIVSDAAFDFVVRCDSGYVRFINNTAALQNNGGQFVWDFGDNQFSNDVNPVHSYTGSGRYDVKLKFVTGTQCIDDSVIHTVLIRQPTITMSPSQTILPGQTITISANSPGANTYQWTPVETLSNPGIKNPQATPLEDVFYKVTATGSDGCFVTDSVLIKVYPLDDFYVPSGFTPNNDGLNDDVKPIFGGQFNLQRFSIFDRWGNSVFSTTQRGQAWNGKRKGIEVAAGVYVWILEAKDRQGKLYTRKGTVALIR